MRPLLMTVGLPRPQFPGWLLLNIGALGSSLAHVFIDVHLGLYGASSSSMAPLQALNIAMTCLVVAWWTLALSVSMGTAKPGLSAAFVLAVGWAFLGGVGLVVAAPPPSDAFPYQDLTHLLSILFGALAAIASWRELKRSRTVWSPPSIAIAVLLLILLFATQGAASASSP